MASVQDAAVDRPGHVMDNSAFIQAMKDLRADLGGQVTFHIPQTPTYAAGVAINPATGRPVDPGAQPTSGGGFDDVVKTVGVITKDASKLRPGADTRFEAGGEFSGMDAILDLDSADHPDVENATRVTVATIEYKIVEWKPGTIGNTIDRYLIYCEEL